MLASGIRTDKGSRQVSVPIREANVFTLLSLDASSLVLGGPLPLPRHRGDLAVNVALELDAGLDRRWDGSPRTNEEPVATCRI